MMFRPGARAGAFPRFMRLLRRILIGLILMAVICAAGLAWLTWSAPAWYEPPSPEDRKAVALADKVEYRLVEEVQKIRPLERDEWTLRVHDGQINAWLSVRLPKWIAHQENAQWPEQLGTPQVRFQPKGVSVALPLREGRFTRTLVARFIPAFVDGKLQLRVDEVSLGRINVGGEPLAKLIELLESVNPEALRSAQVQPIIDLLSQGELVEPELELSDGRRVKLLNVRLGEGTMDLTAVTTPARE